MDKKINWSLARQLEISRKSFKKSIEKNYPEGEFSRIRPVKDMEYYLLKGLTLFLTIVLLIPWLLFNLNFITKSNIKKEE